MTSRDTHPATRVMNRCVISGLLSVGVHVLDLRSYPLPLARYAVRVGGDGGVHVRVAPQRSERADHGVLRPARDHDRQEHRTQDREPVLSRRFPAHARWTRSGTLDFPSRMLERYTAAFLEALSAQALKEAGFKVVIDYAWGNASIVLAAGARRSRRRPDLAQRLLRRAARTQFPRRPRTPSRANSPPS